MEPVFVKPVFTGSVLTLLSPVFVSCWSGLGLFIGDTVIFVIVAKACMPFESFGAALAMAGCK